MANLQQLHEEVWKGIPGYEARYQVSNFGRVKALPVRLFVRSNNTRLYRGKIKASTKMRNGYMATWLKVDNKKKIVYVHRLIAEAFIPNPDSKPQINHRDGDKCNNKLSNLEWVTAEENAQHAQLTGLANNPKGEDNGRAVLSKEEALKIKTLCQTHTTEEIRLLLGLPKTKRYLIANIRCGRIWKHL